MLFVITTTNVGDFDDILGVLENDGYKFTDGETIDVELDTEDECQILSNLLIDNFIGSDITWKVIG